MLLVLFRFFVLGKWFRAGAEPGLTTRPSPLGSLGILGIKRLTLRSDMIAPTKKPGIE
jgi:hypothetical protein